MIYADEMTFRQALVRLIEEYANAGTDRDEMIDALEEQAERLNTITVRVTA